jgi:hypothetical protein
MRKTITTILALGLVAGALLAPTSVEAKKRKPYKRVATYDYTVPAFGQADVGGTCPNAASGCASFATTAKDKFVVVKIEDASGTPVSGTLSHPDTNGDSLVEPLGSFCGQSEKVAIQPGAELIVFPYMIGSTGATESLGGPAQCLGVATQGKITATFTGK